MTLIYLAGPIDAVSLQEANNWRLKAEEDLGAAGIASYNPAAAFNVPPSYEDPGGRARIIDINFSALRFSTGVLAFVGGKSFGTPIEVWQALFDFKIPVFSWGLAERSIYRDIIRVHSTYDEALGSLVAWSKEKGPTPGPLAPGFQPQGEADE